MPPPGVVSSTGVTTPGSAVSGGTFGLNMFNTAQKLRYGAANTAGAFGKLMADHVANIQAILTGVNNVVTPIASIVGQGAATAAHLGAGDTARKVARAAASVPRHSAEVLDQLGTTEEELRALNTTVLNELDKFEEDQRRRYRELAEGLDERDAQIRDEAAVDRADRKSPGSTTEARGGVVLVTPSGRKRRRRPRKRPKYKGGRR